MQQETPSKAAVLAPLGWAALILGLPIALIAATHPPNEYEAVFGINALDCTGPFETYIFAAPALLLYGIGFILSARRWRKLAHLVVALLSLAVLGAVATNVARAVAEDIEQSTRCAARDG